MEPLDLKKELCIQVQEPLKKTEKLSQVEIAWIRQRPMLLIRGNFEHLIQSIN